MWCPTISEKHAEFGAFKFPKLSSLIVVFTLLLFLGMKKTTPKRPAHEVRFDTEPRPSFPVKSGLSTRQVSESTQIATSAAESWKTYSECRLQHFAAR